jgi:heterodisulfide reductase subunit B2
MITIGYYPGCSLSGTASEYDRSLRAIAGPLGFELKEVPQWMCCGATSAHALSHEAALCMAADTLAKARNAELYRVLAPCAMCYQRLATASHDMLESPALAKEVAEALGEQPGIEKVKALSLLSWLADVPDERITAAVKNPLRGLKVACYYGCLLVRPPKITGVDEVESPRSMEKVAALLGAQGVRWSMALECCGASFAMSRKEVVLRQGRRIYDAAAAAGADMIIMACPMCHANLDIRQQEFLDRSQRKLPVLYLTQLMGLAFGMDQKSLGMGAHFVPAEPALSEALART